MSDLISRQATNDMIKNHKSDFSTEKDYRTARACVNAVTFAQPERKRGHWERHNTYYGDDVSGSVDPDWRCSECGGQANVNVWCMYDLTDFCPNCGADMRGEQDETN